MGVDVKGKQGRGRPKRRSLHSVSGDLIETEVSGKELND